MVAQLTTATYIYLHFKHHWSSSNSFSSRIFDTMFDITQQPGDSPISSDPYGVCLCNRSGHIDCSIKTYIFPRSIYPGEAFSISAATVGQRSGVAPAAILGTLIRSPNRCLLQPSEQNISNHCGTLTYVLHSKYQQEMLQLTVQESSLDAGSFYYSYHPPVITISLRSCPWGFTLQ